MTEDNAVVLHVQMTPDDFVSFHREITTHAFGPHWHACLALAGAFLGFSMFFLPAFLGVNSRTIGAVFLSFAIGLIPTLTLFLFASPTKRVRTLDPDGLFLRPHDVTVSSRGISFKSDVAHWNYDWRAFRRIKETPTHFFLYYDRLMAHVIPKHAFATTQEANRLGAILHANIKPA